MCLGLHSAGYRQLDTQTPCILYAEAKIGNKLRPYGRGFVASRLYYAKKLTSTESATKLEIFRYSQLMVLFYCFFFYHILCA